MTEKKRTHCTIYLMRHGQAAPPGIMAGQSEYPLSPEGRAQLAAWAEFFAPIPMDAAWVSPMLRTRQSAELIIAAMNRPLNEENYFIEPDFVELSLGAWENTPKDEVRKKYPKEWEKRGQDFMNFAPPGGESFKDLEQRVIPAFECICARAAEYRHVLIVAHQAVNRAILAHLGEPFAQSWHDIPQDPAGLNELELGKKRSGARKCNIIRVNARAPLWMR